MRPPTQPATAPEPGHGGRRVGRIIAHDSVASISADPVLISPNQLSRCALRSDDTDARKGLADASVDPTEAGNAPWDNQLECRRSGYDNPTRGYELGGAGQVMGSLCRIDAKG